MNIIVETPYCRLWKTYKTTYSARLACMLSKIMKTSKDAPRVYVKEIGCYPEELRLHIAMQFNNGMNWDQYGRWEIDHLDPKSWFNLHDQREVFRCFHWSNLRPLWCEDKVIRRDRRGQNEYKTDYETLKKMTPREYWREKAGQVDNAGSKPFIFG